MYGFMASITKDKTEHVSFRLSKADLEKLKQRAKAIDERPSEYIRLRLHDWFAEEEQRGRPMTAAERRLETLTTAIGQMYAVVLAMAEQNNAWIPLQSSIKEHIQEFWTMIADEKKQPSEAEG